MTVRRSGRFAAHTFECYQAACAQVDKICAHHVANVPVLYAHSKYLQHMQYMFAQVRIHVYI